MGGGLMQLVAYGAQDIYLTGNPQITFFKVVYRRHTNFSMEAIQQTWNGTVATGGRLSATISRNGDLVNKMYVTFSPKVMCAGSSTHGCVPYLGHSLLQNVEIEIGGQKIDKHYGHWMTVWHELTSPNTGGTFPLVSDGKFSTAIPTGGAGGVELQVPPTAAQREAYYCKTTSAGSAVPLETYASIPLQFWFCRNPGLALPLIALQYHEVKVIVQLGTAAQMGSGSTVDPNTTLWCDYIYLDTDERRRFAQVSHEYLIEQVQYQNTSFAGNMDLNFNHPVKELIWACAKADSTSVNGGSSCVTRLKDASGDFIYQEESACKINIKLNGHDRFSGRHTGYFTRTQVAAHHTGHGGIQKTDAIQVYSFALKPEEHQPSGTCNFSRIDNAQLVYSSVPTNTDAGDAAASMHIYAVNYNVLRIMSGMGGLAYSN